MANETHHCAYYASAIHSILADTTAGTSRKCDLASLLLSDLVQNEKIDRYDPVIALLPSLIHLLHSAPHSPSRTQLSQAIGSRFATSELARLHKLLLADSSFASTLLQEQNELELGWSNHRNSNVSTMCDISGAAFEDRAALEARLHSRPKSTSPAEALGNDKLLLSTMLSEARRLLIASDLQATAAAQHSVSAGFGENAQASLGIGFGSIFSSKMSSDSRSAVPYLISAINTAAKGSASTRMETDERASSSSSLPFELKKLVVSLLQAESGAHLAHYVLVNSYVGNVSGAPSSSVSSNLADILLALIDYAHHLRYPTAIRALIPNTEISRGPFSGVDGFPRTSLPSTSPPSRPINNECLAQFSSLGAQGLPDERERELRPRDSLVASNIEILLSLTIQTIFMGPKALANKSGLLETAQRVLERLDKLRLFPHLQALLVFGSSIHTPTPFSNDELSWIRSLATSRDATRRSDWKRFVRLHSNRAPFIAKLTTCPTIVLRTESTHATSEFVDSEALRLRNWLEPLALSIAAFELPCTELLLASLLTATKSLLSLAQLSTESKALGEALHFLICGTALLTLPQCASAPYDQNFATFASLFHVLSLLSNSAGFAAMPELGLLRLLQFLHHLKRVDLIAQCMELVLGVPINATWLRSLVNTTFLVTPTSPSPIVSASSIAMDISQDPAPLSANFVGAVKSMRVSVSSAWIWSAPVSHLTHLTLVNLFYADTQDANGPSILSLFESEGLFACPLSLSVQKHLSTSPIHPSLPSDALRTEPGSSDAWHATGDVWLQWILLRLILLINPAGDFERFNSSISIPSMRGNHDGVGECLWKLCERLSRFVAIYSPRFVHPIHVMALETIHEYTECCLGGSQRFWILERLKSVFDIPEDFADLTQGFHASSPQDASSTQRAPLICRYGAASVFQALILCGYVFVKSPSSGSHNSSAVFNGGLPLESDAPTSDGDATGTMIKRPELLNWISLHTGLTLPNTTRATALNPDSKRRLAIPLKAQLCIDFAGSPSKVLQLCRALLVVLLLPDSIASSSSANMSVPGISGTPLKVAITLFDLLKKAPLSVFPYLPHFLQHVYLSSSKTIRTFVPQRVMEIDFGFLAASDYRRIISDRPFLATLDFVALNNVKRLEEYVVDSVRKLMLPGTSNNDEKDFVAVLAWAYARVSLERTLKACAYAILQANSTTAQSSLSHSIDTQHEQLLCNPRLLFGFDLRLLRRSVFFNYVFYTLVSYYWCLAKVDISNVIESTQTSDASTAVANLNDSMDDENDSKDDDGVDEGSSSGSTSTTKGVSSDASDSPSIDAQAPRGSALTDPFHLRAVKSAKSASTASGGPISKHVSFLSGEQKLAPHDADLLKRLEDSALVLLLIDLMLFVDDLPDTDGMELGVKSELRSGICTFLQRLFVNDGELMNIVHHQGYPSRALPWLVESVPAMHFCLELAPPMLAHSFQRFASSDALPPHVAFSVQMASWVVKRYPTPRSLEIATYIFDLYRSVGKSLHPTLWRSTLPDLSRMVLAFPALATGLVELIQLHDSTAGTHSLFSAPSFGNHSSSSSHMPSIDSLNHTSLLASPPTSSPAPTLGNPISNASFSRSVLYEVFSLLGKGQSVASYLKD